MGLIHIYSGDGKGKTTSSVGLGIRALGNGMKVLFVQFFKNDSSCEVKVLKTLDNITCLHCPKNFGFYFVLSEEEKTDAKKHYNALLNQAIEMSCDYDMVILDEIISTYNYDIIEKTTLIDFLKNNTRLEIVLTGRDPEKELVDMADYISDIQKIKHPFDTGKPARKGIEF